MGLSVKGGSMESAMFRGDPARTGVYAGENTGADWTFGTRGMVRSSPTPRDGVVYLADLTGQVYAVDARTGVLRWVYQADGGIDGSVTVADGVAYVCSGDGCVYAFEAANGSVVWTYRVPDTFGMSTPAVGQGLVVVGGHDGTLLALADDTGELRWSHRADMRLIPQHGKDSPRAFHSLDSSPLIDGDAVYLCDGRLFAVDLATGEQRWRSDVLAHATSSPALAGGLVYAAELSGTVCAVEPDNGRLRWRTDVGDAFLMWSTPAVGDGAVVVCGQETLHGGPLEYRLGGGVVAALDAATGALRWRRRTKGPVPCAAAVRAGTVYVAEAGDDPRLTALDATTGEVRGRRRMPAAGSAGSVLVSSPAVAGDVVYVGVLAGGLLACPAGLGGRAGRSVLRRLWPGRSSRRAAPAPPTRSEPARERISLFEQAELEDQVDACGEAARSAARSGDYRAGVELIGRAVAATERLRQAFPDDPKHTEVLASQLYNRASILAELPDIRAAVTDARRCLQLYRELAADDPDGYAAPVADAQARLGRLLALAGRAGEARTTGAEAVAGYRALAARDPSYRPGLARVLALWTDAMVIASDTRAALRAGREALEAYRGLAGAVERDDAPYFARTALHVVVALGRPTALRAAEAVRAGEDAAEQFTFCVTNRMGGVGQLATAWYHLARWRIVLGGLDNVHRARQLLVDADYVLANLPEPLSPELAEVHRLVRALLGQLG